jgi:hypothetical protein
MGKFGQMVFAAEHSAKPTTRLLAHAMMTNITVRPAVASTRLARQVAPMICQPAKDETTITRIDQSRTPKIHDPSPWLLTPMLAQRDGTNGPSNMAAINRNHHLRMRDGVEGDASFMDWKNNASYRMTG